MERQMEQQSAERRVIATYDTYEEAQRAVDQLADNTFPVQRVAIVAEGLRLVEQVTGRLGYGSAALSGALSGAATGLFFGFIFGLFNLITPLISAFTLALYGLLFGAIIGALMGLVGYALSTGQRDFTSVRGVQAERYMLMVDADVADDALRVLNLRPRFNL
jgi:hypothetical protein